MVYTCDIEEVRRRPSRGIGSRWLAARKATPFRADGHERYGRGQIEAILFTGSQTGIPSGVET